MSEPQDAAREPKRTVWAERRPNLFAQPNIQRARIKHPEAQPAEETLVEPQDAAREPSAEAVKAALRLSMKFFTDMQLLDVRLWAYELDDFAAQAVAAGRAKLPPIPRIVQDTLPDCMMPDGAEPCRGYQRARNAIEILRDEIRALRAERAEPAASYLQKAHDLLGYACGLEAFERDGDPIPDDIRDVATALAEARRKGEIAMRERAAAWCEAWSGNLAFKKLAADIRVLDLSDETPS